MATLDKAYEMIQALNNFTNKEYCIVKITSEYNTNNYALCCITKIEQEVIKGVPMFVTGDMDALLAILQSLFNLIYIETTSDEKLNDMSTVFPIDDAVFSPHSKKNS